MTHKPEVYGREYPIPFEVRRLPFEDREAVEVWPDGARMAFMIELTPEAWEWGQAEARDVHGLRPAPEAPPFTSQTAVDYGFNVGLYRLWEVLEERDLVATAPTTGNVAVQHPEMLDEQARRGHELCGHAYSEGTQMSDLSREEQVEDVRQCTRRLEAVTGETPTGWLSPGLVCTPETVEVLAEEGYRYHCDLQDDELPYFIDTDAGTIVELPYRIIGSVSDLSLYASRGFRMAPDEALHYYKASFDAYYREANRRPQMFVMALHPFVSGRPDPSYVAGEFLDYVLEHDDVWPATFGEVAEHWRAAFDGGYGD